MIYETRIWALPCLEIVLCLGCRTMVYFFCKFVGQGKNMAVTLLIATVRLSQRSLGQWWDTRLGGKAVTRCAAIVYKVSSGVTVPRTIVKNHGRAIAGKRI